MMIGIDVGGTSIKAGIVDENAQIKKKFSIATPFDDEPQIISDTILSQIEMCLDVSDHHATIGIGIAGVVDADGNVLFSPNMPKFKNVHLKSYLESKLKLNITVDNDANAAAIAELAAGAGKDHSDFLYITLGTGIGGAIIAGGKVFRGEYGGAGEIGHTVIDYKAKIEEYDLEYRTGTLEELCGRAGIMKRYAQISGKSEIDVIEISTLAESGDSKSCEVMNETGYMIGLSIASAMNLLDIRTVIIGGGISGSSQIMEAIKSTIKQRALPSIASNFLVSRAKFGDETGIIGAAYLGKSTIK